MNPSLLSTTLLLVCAISSGVAQSSCSGRCGEEYYRGFLCHCDYECIVHDECCKDYISQCTTKDSCKGRCGEAFKRGRGCTCDADCLQYNQCCPDYKKYCDPEESSKEPGSTPEKTSSCNNVNDNQPTAEPPQSQPAQQPDETPVTNNLEEDQDVIADTYPNILTDTEAEVPPIPEDTSGYEPSPSLLPEPVPSDPSLTQPTPWLDIQDDPEQEATAEETYTALPEDQEGDQEGDTGPTDSPPTQAVTGGEADASGDLKGQPDSSQSPPLSEPTLPGSPSAQPSSEPQTAPPPAESDPDPQPKGQGEPQPDIQDVDDKSLPKGSDSPVSDPQMDLIETTASTPTSADPIKNPPSPDGPESTPASTDSSAPSATTPSDVSDPKAQDEPMTTSTASVGEQDDVEETSTDPMKLAATPTKPAPTKPGSTTPGSTTPGSTTPGSTTPGSTKPESTKPGSTTPGSTKPGSTTPGSTKPGSTTPGSTKPGSTTPGSIKPAPTKPGSTKPAPTKPAPTKPSSTKPKPKPTQPSGPSDLAQALGTYNPRDYQSDDNNNTDLCSGRPAGATTTLRNGTVVVFRGHYFWVLDNFRNPGPARKITDVWGVPSPIDTVFTRCNCQGKTYILKGSQYWRFENGMVDQGYPKMVSTGFDGLQGQITAALSVPEYRRRAEAVYFFKRGGLVQKYSYKQGTSPTCGRKVHFPVYTVRNRVARQAASPLGPAINIQVTWKGFPSTVTSAVSIPNRRVAEGYSYYVFSRSKYYNVKMEDDRPVLATPMSTSPKKNSAKDFFNCPKEV